MQNPQLLTLVCFYIYLDLTLIGSQSVALHIYWGGGSFQSISETLCSHQVLWGLLTNVYSCVKRFQTVDSHPGISTTQIPMKQVS